MSVGELPRLLEVGVRKESEVIKLVNIFLDGLVSVSNDCGWTGESVLSKMITFGGDVPRSTGLDQSNLTMINALDNYKRKHKDFALMERIFWRLAQDKTTRRHIMALLTKHYYHGINDRTERVYSEEDKMALWIEHLNRHPWSDPELLKLDQEQVRVKYRYGVQRCGPRLIRREAGL